MQWFRFYGEAISDLKLRKVARDSGQPMATVLGIWAILLTLASDSPERGKLLLGAMTPATCDDISDIAGCNAHETLQKLLCNGMVTECDGVLCIPAWDRRQYESDSSTKRVKKLRQAAQNAPKVPNVTPVKRYSNVSVTPPDTDTDTDTEEQQFKSFAAVAAPPATPAPVDVAPKAPKQPTAQGDMFGALAECCQIDGNLKANKGRIGKTAADLVSGGYTPDQVRAFPAWWRVNDWRAKSAPVPTLAQVTEKIAQSLNGDVAHVNGNGQVNGRPKTTLDYNFEAVDRVFAMMENGEKI